MQERGCEYNTCCKGHLSADALKEKAKKKLDNFTLQRPDLP